MATPAGADGGEVSIKMPATGVELERRESAAAIPERTLNRFVRLVAFGEWVGNAFGALAFVWATAVLLGGFGSSLLPKDFWFATVMVFIEAFRIFSRDYRLDNRSLFGTTKALRWISSSFTRILWQPHEGDEIVLIMGLWMNLIDQLRMDVVPQIIEVALLIHLSRRPRRPGRLQIYALLTSYLGFQVYALVSSTLSIFVPGTSFSIELLSLPVAIETLLANAIESAAVLLLVLRPHIIAILTDTRCGRILLLLAKVISVVWLFSGPVMDMWPLQTLTVPVDICYIIGTSFASMVLSLSSLQTPPTPGLLGRWIDVALRICFLSVSVFPLPNYLFQFLGHHPSEAATSSLSLIIILVLLLVGNLQIPAAIVQVVLSSLRYHQLRTRDDYLPRPKDGSPNMVPAIEVFYLLALCQGSSYIMASFLGAFSIFPRRYLVRQSKFNRRGAEAIDIYYHRAYATCMDTGLLAARKTMSLANFVVESLSSSSGSIEVQLAAVFLLENLLPQETDSSEELKSRIIRSNKALSILIGMLGWSDARYRDIRLFAARVAAKLAGSIRIDRITGTVKLVSSLLDAESDRATAAGPIINGESALANLPRGQDEPSKQTTSGTGGCSRVNGCWQRMKERWSILEEPPLTHQDSLPVLGMVILEKLSCDLDNCAEMLKDKILISKVIRLIRYDTTDNDEQQNAVICSSLNLLRRLAATGENIGVALRQELWKSNFLLNNLMDILENRRNSPEVLEPAMDIIAKLALNKRAGHEIGRIQVIIRSLLHALLGRDGSASMMYYDHSLRMAAGEALANIATWGTANCSAILAEQGYEIIKDVNDFLSEDGYRNVAATLLENICAHCRDKLRHDGASEHLSSALPVVMENIMSTGGKQLESLIGLASQICDVIPSTFARELDSHTNAAVLARKLVRTLNSNKKPNTGYPRMRRVVIEITISIVKSCPRYASIFKEEGMVGALTTVERTPSKVEKYRTFYGNVGVVLESGTSLTALVAKAKGAIDSAAPIPGGQHGDHS